MAHTRACTACVFLFHSRHSCTPLGAILQARSRTESPSRPGRQQEAVTFFHSGRLLLPRTLLPYRVIRCRLVPNRSAVIRPYLNSCHEIPPLVGHRSSSAIEAIWQMQSKHLLGVLCHRCVMLSFFFFSFCTAARMKRTKMYRRERNRLNRIVNSRGESTCVSKRSEMYLVVVVSRQ